MFWNQQDALIHRNREALAREIISDRQRAKSPPIKQHIGKKVHRPTVIRFARLHATLAVRGADVPSRQRHGGAVCWRLVDARTSRHDQGFSVSHAKPLFCGQEERGKQQFVVSENVTHDLLAKLGSQAPANRGSPMEKILEEASKVLNPNNSLQAIGSDPELPLSRTILQC